MEAVWCEKVYLHVISFKLFSEMHKKISTGLTTRVVEWFVVEWFVVVEW